MRPATLFMVLVLFAFSGCKKDEPRGPSDTERAMMPDAAPSSATPGPAARGGLPVGPDAGAPVTTAGLPGDGGTGGDAGLRRDAGR